MRWDYQTVVLTGGFLGRHKDELKRVDLEAQFDALGAQGFELAWILMDQSLQGEKDGHVVVFKRPIPDPAPTAVADTGGTPPQSAPSA